MNDRPNPGSDLDSLIEDPEATAKAIVGNRGKSPKRRIFQTDWQAEKYIMNFGHQTKRASETLMESDEHSASKVQFRGEVGRASRRAE